LEHRAKDRGDCVEELLGDCETFPEDLMDSLKGLRNFSSSYLAKLPRKNQRQHGEIFLDGLLSDLDRKSVEPIAERAKQDRWLLQYFVGQSPWRHEPLLDELCRGVSEELGDPNGILVIDPSAFPKKGGHSVGVARQWCGRLGKQDNCQVGVFLGYKSNKGHTLVDERLFLPRKWAGDRAGRKKCGVPKGLRFKDARQLALEMVRERRQQLPHAWVTADDEFGRTRRFRKQLNEMGERYVLDVPSNTVVRDLKASPPRRKSSRGAAPKVPFMQARTWKDKVPKEKWEWIPIRAGTKGPIGVWAVGTRVQTRKREGITVGTEEWLVVTKTDSKNPDYRYHLSNAGEDVTLDKLVHVASARYWIEDCFERGKGEVGMDHYEVRTWLGWHHHMTFCLLGLFFLTLEQRRLNKSTPALTVQQTAHAVAEILRSPAIDIEELASKITKRLRRIEQSRIDHWKKIKLLPPTWKIVRSSHVPNLRQ